MVNRISTTDDFDRYLQQTETMLEVANILINDAERYSSSTIDLRELGKVIAAIESARISVSNFRKQRTQKITI